MTNTFEPSEFISKIVQDADTGWSFVPLIGSGLSSASGIIMGMEFTNYLAFTTYLVLADPESRRKTHGEGKPERWDLSKKGWPPLPSQKEVQSAREWILIQFKSLCDRLSLELNYDSNADPKCIKSITFSPSNSSSRDLLSILSHPMIPTILASAEMARSDEKSRRFVDFLAKGSSPKHYPGSFAVDELVADAVRSYHQRIVEMGIRSLHDWRETIVFLSSVRVSHDGTKLEFADACNSAVIDAFNTFITRDRQPNLGHKMLVHLASPLRIQTILTTNFDTLLEDAYRALALSIRVLPVSTKGRLPEARTVSAHDSLVKLHGEAHDTRADLSLDEDPERVDLNTFAAYLTRGGGYAIKQTRYEARRLLTIGYSGSDLRCIQMVKHWLETFPASPVVYWICFSEGDVKKVSTIFGAREYRGKIRITQSSRPDLLLYELYQRIVLALPPGGLTYEFSHIVPPRRLQSYDSDRRRIESLTECVSHSGYLLESARVLVGNAGTLRETRTLARDAIVKLLAEILTNAMLGKLSRDKYEVDKSLEHRPRVLEWSPVYRLLDKTTKVAFDPPYLTPLVLDAIGGVVRASALAVDRVSSKGVKVFWMETQDYVDVDAMVRDFLRGLALRFGQFQKKHVTLHPLGIRLSAVANNDGWTANAELIAKHISKILLEYRADPHLISVLIYGRDSYGACSGLLPSVWQQDSSEFKALHCFIEALARSGIRVIYFPLLKDRAELKVCRQTVIQQNLRNSKHQIQRPDQLLQSWGHWSYDEFCSGQFESHPDISAYSLFKDILVDLIGSFYAIDIGDKLQVAARAHVIHPQNEKYLTFIYALTLFRHSRHPNALCSEATFQCPARHNMNAIDNDFIRSEESAEWISQFRSARVFFDKPGGSVWMHRDVRQTLQNILETTHLADEKDRDRRCNHNFVEMRARLHFWIGDWYFKAFCSSGHLTPIIEAVHHRVMAAMFAHLARPKYRKRESLDDRNLLHYRVLLFESTIIEAGKTLLMAWPSLKLWQASSIDASWMDEKHREIVREGLAPSMQSLVYDQEKLNPRDSKKLKVRLKSVVDDFIAVLKSVCTSLTLEGGGGSRTASPNVDRQVVHSISSDYRSISDDESKLNLGHGWEDISTRDSVFETGLYEVFGMREVGKKGLELAKSFMKLPTDGSPGRHTELVEELSIQKAEWKHINAKDSRCLAKMIWLLGETAYVLLRRAKLMFHATGRIDFKRWVQSTIACNLGIDMCKHLPASYLQFETNSKVKLHTLYSVGLANLGRFFESNRHLNEAQALLSKSETVQPSDYSIICLRRAESRLTECFWIGIFLSPGTQIEICSVTSEPCLKSSLISERLGADEVHLVDGDTLQKGWSMQRVLSISGKRRMVVPPRVSECIRKAKTPRLLGSHSLVGGADPFNLLVKDNLTRLYMGTLDEAVALLDQAEKGLSGFSQSSLWWCRLHTLRLRVFGMLPLLEDQASCSLILRKTPADLAIHENFINAYRIASNDPFRRLRAVKYFFEANDWHRNFVEPGTATRTFLPDTYKIAKEAADRLFKERDNLFKKSQSTRANYPLKFAISNLEDELNSSDSK